MDWITTAGASIDEAKSNALDQLGIVADEAEFDIVNDVEKGLFGRIKTEAKVRARVRPKAPAAKDDRRRRSGGKGRQSASGKPGANNGRQSKSRDGGGSGRSRSGGGKGAGRGGAKGAGRGDGDRPKQQKPSKPKGQRPQRDDQQTSRDSRARQESARQSDQQGQTEPAMSSDDGGSKRSDKRSGSSETKRNNVDHEFSREEQEQVAVKFLEGLVEVLEMSGSVALAEDEAEDGAIELAVTGDELGLLVGPKGSTLNAVQELTRTVVQRESQGARTERLRVDVAGYRQRRTAALQEFAQGIAQDVIDSGSEKILEPMGPADRKVVHDAVNEIDGVETGSEGEEPRRRVVIRPAD